MKDSASHLVQVVNILQDGNYHDDTSMSKKLNITRGEVWKILQQLIDYNILSNFVKNKG